MIEHQKLHAMRKIPALLFTFVIIHIVAQAQNKKVFFKEFEIGVSVGVNYYHGFSKIKAGAEPAYNI